MENWTTPDEATALLRSIFPGGLQSPDLVRALCPDGWENSPLHAAVHPSPEVHEKELADMQENLKHLGDLFGKKKQHAKVPPPQKKDLPDFEKWLPDRAERQPETTEQEVGRLVGLCAWNIFSDNHDVLLPDGREAHLGSFRGSAGEIAEFYYNKPPAPPPDFSTMKSEADLMAYMKANMDYMEFYMGSRMIAHRTSLRPVYSRA